MFSSACLADEEMKLDEEKIDELTKKEEYERIKAQLKAKRVEEERKIAEEKRCLFKIKILESRPALFFFLSRPRPRCFSGEGTGSRGRTFSASSFSLRESTEGTSSSLGRW